MIKYIITFLIGACLVSVALTIFAGAAENNSWIGLDTAFHVAGGIFAAWCSYFFSKRVGVVVVGAMLIGLLWEASEHLSSIFGEVYWPKVYYLYHGGSLIDTVSDLAADFIGAMVFVLVYCRYEAQKNKR